MSWGKWRWNFDCGILDGLGPGNWDMGLLRDSGVVVIEARLVAPLMRPFLGTGRALAQENGPLCRR